MARPRKAVTERRSEIIRFTATPAESIRIHKAAARAGATLSRYARTMVLEGRIVVHQTRTLNPAVIDQLRRIGINLNQLARVAHREGRVPRELAKLCATLELFLMQHITDGSEGPP